MLFIFVITLVSQCRVCHADQHGFSPSPFILGSQFVFHIACGLLRVPKQAIHTALLQKGVCVGIRAPHPNSQFA